MCHSSESTLGRTQPVPRKPGNRSASAEPARTQAIIWSTWSGWTWRVIDTVTGRAVTGSTVEVRRCGRVSGSQVLDARPRHVDPSRRAERRALVEVVRARLLVMAGRERAV